jgi:hypothetical protein
LGVIFAGEPNSGKKNNGEGRGINEKAVKRRRIGEKQRGKNDEIRELKQNRTDGNW